MDSALSQEILLSYSDVVRSKFQQKKWLKKVWRKKSIVESTIHASISVYTKQMKHEQCNEADDHQLDHIKSSQDSALSNFTPTVYKKPRSPSYIFHVVIE